MNDRSAARDRRGWLDAVLAAGVFGSLFLVYVVTLLPGLGGTEDTSKFQYIGAALGTAHDPGYPLYLLLSYAISKLPIGALAYRINLMSACWGALTGALVYLVLRRLSVHAWLAIAVALGLGFGRTFWQHSVFAEVYTLSTALMAATLLALLQWDATECPDSEVRQRIPGGASRLAALLLPRIFPIFSVVAPCDPGAALQTTVAVPRNRGPRRTRWLYAAVAFASLSFGNHLIIIGALPALVLFVLMTLRWRLRMSTALVCLAIVVAGAAQYSYVWIRTLQHSPYLEARAEHVGDLWNVLRARQFDAFQESPVVVVQERIPAVLTEARKELGTFAATASLAGAVIMMWRRPRMGLLLVLAGIGQGGLLAMLGEVSVGPILLPALVPAWCLAGTAFAEALRALARMVPPKIAVCVVGLASSAVPVMHAAANFSFNDHRHDTYDTNYLGALFAGLPDRTAFVDEEYTLNNMLAYQRFVTGAEQVAVGLAPDLPAIDAMLRDGYEVFAFGGARARLWGGTVLRDVTLPGLTLEQRVSNLPEGRVAVLAGSASTWPIASSLGLDPRTPLRGRAIVVAVKGRGIAAITPEGFEGDISFRQGDPLGGTGTAARVSFRAAVSGSHASVFIEDELVADTDTGVVVVEIDAGLEAAYTLRRENGMRAPVEMRRRPLYRVVSRFPPNACTLVGDGHWSVLSDPGREGLLQGRVDNREPGVARWQVYVASLTPMAVRLGEVLGRGTPAITVEYFDMRKAGANGLRDRLRSDGVEHPDLLMNAPSVTRVEVAVNDEGQFSSFRLSLGGMPTAGLGRAIVDHPAAMRADVCGIGLDRLVVGAENNRTRLYLGPGADAYFGTGWRDATRTPFGFERKISAPRATVFVPLQEPRVLVLNLRMAGDREAGDVEAVVNGHALGWRTFQRVWTDLYWQAPADVWIAGVNEVVLRIRSARTAGGADGVTPQPAPPVTVRRVAVQPGG
jgi:hypothetical protein